MPEHEMRSECGRRFDHIEKKADDIGVIKETILKLEMLFNQMIADNQKRDIREQKRDEQDEKLTDAINGINVNLTDLNKDSKDMQKRVGHIEESQKIQEERFKVNWADMIKQGIIAFGLLGVGALLAGMF